MSLSHNNENCWWALMVVNRRCYTILGSKFSWNWTSFVHSAAPWLLCCMNHLFHLLTNPFILECIFNSCCNHIDTRKSRFDQYIIWSTKILTDYKCIVNNTCLYVYIFYPTYCLRKVWRYQMGNQKLLIEGQAIQWQKGKRDKMTNNHLQNITEKTKGRATRTPLKSGGELMCSGRVGTFCSTCARFIMQ